MAAVHNHLLSFTVLALLNAHSSTALCQSDITLGSEKISLDDLHEDEFGTMVYREVTGDAAVSLERPLKLEFNRETEPNADWLDMAFFSHSDGKLSVNPNTFLSLKVQGAESVTGVRTQHFQGFGQEKESLSISLDAAHIHHGLEYAVAWSLSESVCDLSDNAPDSIHLDLHTTGLAEGATAAALLLSDSDFTYQGRLVIRATDENNPQNV